MILERAARAAARAVHAYRAELARLAPPRAPAKVEQNATAATTERAWSPTTRPPAAARAEDGPRIGFGKQ